MAIYGESYSKFKTGDDLVNGTFDTDSDWTKASGWTISGGKAHWDGDPLATLSSTPVLVIGAVYTFVFTVSNYTGSNPVGIESGQFSEGAIGYASADGTYTATGTNLRTQLIFYGRATNTYSLDNVTMALHIIDLNHSTIEPDWGREHLIKNTSVFTRETTFTKLVNDFARFTVTVNIWKNAIPGDAMIAILPHNHDIVNFMPHRDSGIYIQKVGGGDANFYIESMTPVYVKNEPPLLQDKLIIKFVSLEAVDASRSIP